MAPLSFVHGEVPGLVTIVIPTYRCEEYIGQSLDSISQQAYENWEVIVVEDGPAGPTQQIVEEFARRHPSHRVEYLCNGENCGPSHSRNRAFALAAGEFVAFLDSDDRWMSEHLARSVRELRESSADLAYSTVLVIEDKTDYIFCAWGPNEKDLDNLAEGLFRRNFITPSATVIRRRVLEELGGWDVNLRHCEDLSFWLRCYAAGKKFHYVGGCHCWYRKNREGAATRKECETYEKFALVLEQHMHLPGLNSKPLRKLAAKAYYRAGRSHARFDRRRDASADRDRSSSLFLHAWRLKPAGVKYLIKGVSYAIMGRLRGRKRVALPRVVPVALPTVTVEEPLRRAA